jgi:hypothetical protein
MELTLFASAALVSPLALTHVMLGLFGLLLANLPLLSTILSGIGLDVPNPEKHSPQRYSSLASHGSPPSPLTSWPNLLRLGHRTPLRHPGLAALETHRFRNNSLVTPS